MELQKPQKNIYSNFKYSGNVLPVIIITVIVTALIVSGISYVFWQKGEINRLKNEVKTNSGTTNKQTNSSIGENKNSSVTTIPTLVKNSELISKDAIWDSYINYKFGFSIDVPKNTNNFYGGCKWSSANGDHSYRPENKMVPVKIFEAGNSVYISNEYYYKLTGEVQENGRSYFSNCEKEVNSLKLLQDKNNYYNRGWEIVVGTGDSDNDLKNVIHENYGAECNLGKKSLSGQDNVYDIEILSDGKQPPDTKCFLNFHYIMKFYPQKHEVIFWNPGQAASYWLDDKTPVDEEMIKSFRFL